MFAVETVFHSPPPKTNALARPCFNMCFENVGKWAICKNAQIEGHPTGKHLLAPRRSRTNDDVSPLDRSLVCIYESFTRCYIVLEIEQEANLRPKHPDGCSVLQFRLATEPLGVPSWIPGTAPRPLLASGGSPDAFFLPTSMKHGM